MSPTTQDRNSARATGARIAQRAHKLRRKPVKNAISKPPPTRVVLGDIRLRLGVADAVATVASAALRSQGTEEAATALRVRLLSAQIDRLDAVHRERCPMMSRDGLPLIDL